MPEGVLKGMSGADLLSQEVNSLSLARSCFTVLFGKGRGGSKTLWAPDETDVLGLGLVDWLWFKHLEESRSKNRVVMQSCWLVAAKAYSKL